MARPSSSSTDLALGTAVGVIADVTGHAASQVARIRLDPAREQGIAGIDYVDQPTFLLLPETVDEGSITVDVQSAIVPGVSAMSRGFAGVAFHVADDLSCFECVYLRPANGTRENPPAPRDRRAVQYFSYPEWPFDRLREERGGEFESGADIGLGQWIRLAIHISARSVTAAVDGTEVLAVPRLEPAPVGRVGLFVDIGTDARFRAPEIVRIQEGPQP